MKIVILGSTGQVGSAITKTIRSTFPEAEILACGRKPRLDIFPFNPYIDEWKTLGKPDIIINSIGAMLPTANYSLHQIHVGLAEKFRENFDQIGRPRIINISALGANTTHSTAFLRTKGQADEILNQLPKSVILRPSVIHTPENMIWKRLYLLVKISWIFGGYLIIPFSLANCLLQPILVGDLATIVAKLITKTEYIGINEIAGPEKYRVKQLVELIAFAKNRTIGFLYMNDKIADFIIGELVTGLMPRILNKDQYKLLKEDNISDNNQAEAIMGRVPESVIPALKEMFK